MNKIEILLLKIIKYNEYTTSYSSITAYDLSNLEDFRLKYDTIYRYLKKLVKKGFLQKGLQDGRRITFYITQEGIRKLEEHQNE